METLLRSLSRSMARKRFGDNSWAAVTTPGFSAQALGLGVLAIVLPMASLPFRGRVRPQDCPYNCVYECPICDPCAQPTHFCVNPDNSGCTCADGDATIRQWQDCNGNTYSTYSCRNYPPNCQVYTNC